MSKTPIYIFGLGGHAKVIADAAITGSDFQLAAFVGPNDDTSAELMGIPTISESAFFMDAPEMPLVIIGVGNNDLRRSILQKIMETRPDTRFAKVIHPSAVISPSVTINAGSFINAGVIINCDSNIGTHTVINTGAIIDHDCRLSNFTTIGPGAILGGNVTISEGAFIALGCKIIHGLSVGKHSLIAAGSTLVNDAGEFGVYMGTPAKQVSSRKFGDAIL